MSAQQEYDALVSQLRANPTEYEGHPILEWDVYPLDRPILDKDDPNIVVEVKHEIWLSIQVATPPQTAPPGTPGLGGRLIDRHWTAGQIVTGDPKARNWRPQPEPPVESEDEDKDGAGGETSAPRSRPGTKKATS